MITLIILTVIFAAASFTLGLLLAKSNEKRKFFEALTSEYFKEIYPLYKKVNLNGPETIFGEENNYFLLERYIEKSLIDACTGIVKINETLLFMRDNPLPKRVKLFYDVVQKLMDHAIIKNSTTKYFMAVYIESLEDRFGTDSKARHKIERAFKRTYTYLLEDDGKQVKKFVSSVNDAINERLTEYGYPDAGKNVEKIKKSVKQLLQGKLAIDPDENSVYLLKSQED